MKSFWNNFKESGENENQQGYDDMYGQPEENVFQFPNINPNCKRKV